MIDYMKKLFRHILPVLFSVLIVCMPAYTETGGQHSNPDISYHGMRMMRKSPFFYVRKIETVLSGNNQIFIDIHFNTAVDPRTVTIKSILLNNEPLPADTGRMFNKAGNVLRLSLPLTYSSELMKSGYTQLQLTLCSAESFNGTKLSQNQFGGLSCGNVYVYTNECGHEGRQ